MENSINELNNKLKILFPKYKEIDCTIGSRIVFESMDNNIQTELYLQGNSNERYIFKDIDTYDEKMTSICYISENDFEEIYDSINEVMNEYEQESMTLSELAHRINNINSCYGYTHDTLSSICNNQEEISRKLFLQLDWTDANTLLDEWYRDNEINDYIYNYNKELVLTEGLSLEEHLYNLYKKDWLKQRDLDESLDLSSMEDGESYVSFEEFKNIELFEFKQYIHELVKDYQKFDHSYHNNAESIFFSFSKENCILLTSAHFEENSEIVLDEQNKINDVLRNLILKYDVHAIICGQYLPPMVSIKNYTISSIEGIEDEVFAIAPKNGCDYFLDLDSKLISIVEYGNMYNTDLGLSVEKHLNQIAFVSHEQAETLYQEIENIEVGYNAPEKEQELLKNAFNSAIKTQGEMPIYNELINELKIELEENITETTSLISQQML